MIRIVGCDWHSSTVLLTQRKAVKLDQKNDLDVAEEGTYLIRSENQMAKSKIKIKNEQHAN